jgi:hypothetical protein
LKVKRKCEVRNKDKYKSEVNKREGKEVSAKASVPPYG